MGVGLPFVAIIPVYGREAESFGKGKMAFVSWRANARLMAAGELQARCNRMGGSARAKKQHVHGIKRNIIYWCQETVHISIVTSKLAIFKK